MTNWLKPSGKVEDWSVLEDFLGKNFHPVSPNPMFIDNLRKNLRRGSQITLENLDQSWVFLFSFLAIFGGIVLIVLWLRILGPIISILKINLQMK
jgi:hypothetical protein